MLSNVITIRNQALRFRQLGVAIVMDRGERFALFHAGADALVKFESHAVIDLVFLFFAAPAKHGERDAEALAVRPRDEASCGAGHIHAEPSVRKTLRIVHHALVSALQSNSLFEFFPRLAAG